MKSTRASVRCIIAISVGLTAMAAGLSACAPDEKPVNSDLTNPNASWPADGASVGPLDDVTASEGARDEGDIRKNRTQWLMPLDEFSLPTDGLDNYAEQLLLKGCLEPQGFDWPVPWQDPDGRPHAANSSPLTTENAALWGYGGNTETSADIEAWREFTEVVNSTGSSTRQQAVERCLAQIRTEHPPISVDDNMYVSGLVAEASEAAKQDPSVQAAAAKWRSCMGPLGLAGLPDTPSEMPTDEIREQLDIYMPVADESVDPDKLIPSERHLEVAQFDVQCREDSGYSDTLYDVEWDLQESAVERERAKLDRIREELETRRADVQQIIAANAPTHD